MSDFDFVLAKVKAAGAGKEDDMRMALIEMDVDGSGFLNESELEQALAKAGVALAKQEVITIVRKYDVNGDGRVSVEEFFTAIGYKFEE